MSTLTPNIEVHVLNELICVCVTGRFMAIVNILLKQDCVNEHLLPQVDCDDHLVAIGTQLCISCLEARFKIRLISQRVYERKLVVAGSSGLEIRYQISGNIFWSFRTWCTNLHIEQHHEIRSLIYAQFIQVVTILNGTVISWTFTPDAYHFALARLVKRIKACVEDVLRAFLKS